MRFLINYWHKQNKVHEKDKLSGLAHSLLVLLDGDTSLPAFMVIPMPHPDDKQFNIDEDQDYYPITEGDFPNDIAGALHEMLYSKEF